MTDRELLELAAKAAGNGARFRSDDAFGLYDMISGNSRSWNPLDNDGDALRLAVKLNLNVFQTGSKAYALPQDDTGDEVGTYHGSDPYAATRRAIVRAAAEIGAMQ